MGACFVCYPGLITIPTLQYGSLGQGSSGAGTGSTSASCGGPATSGGGGPAALLLGAVGFRACVAAFRRFSLGLVSGLTGLHGSEDVSPLMFNRSSLQAGVVEGVG